MKKLISVFLTDIMMVSLVACGGASSAKMTMGTGGTAGIYYAYGGVLGQYIKNHAEIDVVVVSTDGSKANIQSIDAGDYQLGTVQSDVLAYAWEGTRSFQEEGKIDAAFIVAGPPTPAITELCTTNDAYLVPIDGEVAEKLMADCPCYTEHGILPAPIPDRMRM